MEREQRLQLINYIVDNVDTNDYSLAKLVYTIYKDQYCITLCGNTEKWFKYNGTNWQLSSDIRHELKRKLSEEVAQFMSDARTKLRNECAIHDSSFIESRIKRLVMVEQNLYNARIKDRILKECESLFYKKELPVHS